jgi:hypothetical protein
MAESKPAAYDAVAAGAFVAAAERVKPHTKLIALLALGHFVIDVDQGSLSTFSVSIVLGQSYLPRHAGMASELIVGFAIGLGGAGVTAPGWVADRWGVPAALWISAMMPLVAFVPTRFLPPPREAIA